VLAAIACVEQLQGRRLPCALEVIAFADEEGLRFGTTYLGSAAVAGSFDPATLELTDADGISVAEAIRAAGADPGALVHARREATQVLAYCEAHIEQGPLLESLDLPVGVVSAIAGQSRLSVSFAGLAGHAGTVPMELRRDALCAAAAFVLAAEGCAREWPGLVATVGQLAVQPGASNVIPGAATLSLDVRHQDDRLRVQARDWLHDRALCIAAERGVSVSWRVLQESPAVPCDPALSDLLARAVEGLGLPAHRLPSGAGHDAVALAGLAPVAMLFVRCRGGVSHHPDEAVALGDVAVAIEALGRFIMLFAAR
jgi:allantoate deiminase